MKRTGIRKLAIKRETLRRLVDHDLGRVAGGLLTICTYRYSGCVGDQSDVCPTEECWNSLKCDSNCCL
jgi:hypothetical protein